METMYWIDVLGNISTTTTVLAVLCVVSTVVTFIIMAVAYSDGKKDEANSVKKHAKKLGVCSILFVMLAAFTPSTKSLYMIYGVGGTLDYLKENETAKQLPDKVVMALDKWVDSQIEDENKDKDK